MHEPTREMVQTKYRSLQHVLDERATRLWAATEARALGRGGVTLVAAATGISRKRIGVGLRELRDTAARDPQRRLPPGRVRRPGGGRKPKRDTDPTLLADLEALVEPVTRGDPMSPLRWTCKSLDKLVAGLAQQGHRVGRVTVRQLLRSLDYRLQSPRKSREGEQHLDRKAQFEHINAQAQAFQAAGQPVISVDTKKKELIGDFANGGQEWQPTGSPELVRTHDFPDPQLGKVIPYGVYDLEHNEAQVSVGVDHEHRADRAGRARRGDLSDRGQGERRRTGRGPSDARRVSR